MTSTLDSDTTPDAPPPAPTASGFSTSLNTVVNSAPELKKSPGLSVGIASAGGDTQGNAQAVARGTNAISDSNAHNSVAQAVGGGNVLQSALDWFGNHISSTVGQYGSDVIKGAEKVGESALSTLNKPMQIVQHEYRYLHDVEATHGMGAAVLEGIGIAAGGVAGLAATGNPYGAVLGAEAATGAESQMFYKDSWERTGKASYVDPNTHNQVSLGRDIISELSHWVPGLENKSVGFKVTSGLIDGIFDMNVGGTEVLGLAGAANSAEGLGGALGDYFPGKAPQTTEAFDDLMNSFSGRNVQRAFDKIAGQSAGEIANDYRSLAGQDEFLNKLSNASTGDEVAELFRSAIRTHELAFMEKLPTLSVGRLPFQAMHEYMGNSEIPGVQRLYKATSRLPTSWDDVQGLWTNKDFDAASTKDSGVLGIFRTALFTENENTAASIAQAYSDADVPGRMRIWENLQMSTLINMAGYHGYTKDEYLAAAFDDPQVRAEWGHAIDEAIAQGMFGKSAVYGVDDQARDLSQVRDVDTGATHSAAITQNQTGRFEYLDLAKVRRAGQILGGQNVRSAIGGFDDFAYDHITAAIFKRWVLMSPSYAMHISLAELIPNALRLGPFTLVRSAVEGRMAELGLKVEDGDINAVEGIVYKTLRHIPGLSIDSKNVQYATDAILDNDGQIVPRALSSGHNYADEIIPRDERAVSLTRRGYFDSGKTAQKLSDDFGMFGTGNEQGLNAWQATLRESSKDPASQMAARLLIEDAARGATLDDATARATQEVATYLRSNPEEYEGFFLRSLPNITSFPEGVDRPPDMDQFDEWANAIVKKVLGETKGVDGTLHVPLLSHIANGELADDDELSDIPQHQRPLLVKGREAVPSGDPALQRIANWGFRRVLNPMVNFLSRQPIWMSQYIKERELLQDAVDNGWKTEDEARVGANISATQKVIDNVHNLTDRTQWTVTFRNWAPFYFAQEQAYRRMGRLLAEDPAAFRKYQLMITSMHNVGQIFGGKDGQGYLVIPGTGFMTAGAVASASLLGLPVDTATPVGMGWNLSSSSVIFPLSAGFRPDVGPLLSIPVSAFAQFFPETLSPVLKADMTAAATTLLGPTATEPIYEQMVPNTILQRLLTAWAPGFDQRSFNSTMMQTLATLTAEGKVPPADANYRQMQTFIDRVRLQTRILYTMKAIVGAATPVSPELTNETYNQFSGDLAAEIDSHKSIAAGYQAFAEKYPDAWPFAVAQSQNLTGTSLPSSVSAENWINENADLINKFPNAAILLMPQVGKTYNQAVYNEQIAQSLRAKLDPDQWTQDGAVPSYIDALYIGAGNAIFYKWYGQYENQIKGLAGTEKYDAEQAFWGDGSPGSGTIGKYGLQNPVWYNWFNSDTRETQRGETIKQMTTLLDDNPNLKTPIAQNTRVLLKGYANYEKQITTLSQDGASSALQTDAKDAWTSYLQGVATSDPEMINVITAMFMSISDEKAPAVNITNTPGAFKSKSWRP
jgi:hypothetical protein